MLTTAQLAVFKTAVLGDAALAAWRTAGDAGSIAAYYNAPTAANLWRPSIPVSELNNAIVWTEYLATTVARQNAYLAMISGGSVDATKSGIQAGFASIFAGSVSLTNLTALAKRPATRFEKLFEASEVSPVFGYIVSVADVGEALAA